MLSQASTGGGGGRAWSGGVRGWEVGVVHGWGDVWLGGMHGGGGGACMSRMPPGQILRLRHTVNERTVRILLECILVFKYERFPFTRSWFCFCQVLEV